MVKKRKYSFGHISFCHIKLPTVTDLDKISEITIESVLRTFKGGSVILWASWSRIKKIGLSPNHYNKVKYVQIHPSFILLTVLQLFNITITYFHMVLNWVHYFLLKIQFKMFKMFIDGLTIFVANNKNAIFIWMFFLS